MKRLLLLVLSLFCLLAKPAAGADQVSDLREENQLLKEELKLARGGKLYMLVDLPASEITLKAGGVTGRRLKIDTGRVIGDRPAVKLRRLVGKKALFQPKRREIKIAADIKATTPAAGNDTVTALEIDDMPTNYRLVLDDGITLVVHAGGDGLAALLNRGWRRMWDSVRRAMTGFYRGLRGEPAAAELFLTLPDTDARQLYWSFDEKTPCLIRNSATL